LQINILKIFKLRQTTIASAQKQYDIVIAGGGSAGGPLPAQSVLSLFNEVVENGAERIFT